jgi:hypothetical protein
MANKPSDDFIEQKITKQVTITAGNTGAVEIDIPKDKEVFLKGYGYSWFTSNIYNLSTGNMSFPSRSDQEGSPAIPVLFGTPFKCRSGGKLRLSIANNDAADHTYDVVFYIISNEILDVTSEGGDLNLSIGGSEGTASSVAIVDSTGSTFADVTANGLEVSLGTSLPAGTNNIGDVDIASALPTGTNNIGTMGESRTAAHTAPTIGSSSTTALASNVNRKGALFINDSDETIYLNIAGTAVSNTGIRLNANGGSFEISQEKGNLSTAAITGICASGSKTLLVTEWS